MTMTADNPPRHLYLHVPFCASVCFYCDFCRTVITPQNFDAWLRALEKELAARKISPALDTVYIGGGTPVSPDAVRLDRLLGMTDPYTRVCREYTVEVNPECLDEEKADILKRHGVNRVSIGYQTDDPDMLKVMNRRHTADDTEECVRLLRRHGIANISLDIMYSLPGQTMEQLRKSVERALRMEPDHLSLYSLTVEEGTVFAKKGLAPCDEETEADMYEWIVRTLPRCGYEQYEISNFARPSRESEHNLAYWNYRDFYGVSCGASGMENGIRYDNARSLKAYLEDPLQREEIRLSEADMMFEYLMMGLRKKKGISREEFRGRFGKPVEDVYGVPLKEACDSGMLEIQGDSLRASASGYELLNTVLESFLP